MATSLDVVHEPASGPIKFVEDDDSAFVLPPLPNTRICPWCRGLLDSRDRSCFNCEENATALDGRVQSIMPISLYAKPSPLRDWLTFYKDDGEVLADENAGEAIESILRRFFATNARWLEDLAADYAIVVPSTLRPPPHPLAVLLQRAGVLPFDLHFGLRRTTAQLGHNRPSKTAFEAADQLAGKRILLLDDVYTSGARAQSAAFTLRDAGAEVAALCIVGRRYNPAYSIETADVYAQQAAMPFSWLTAAREATQTSSA